MYLHTFAYVREKAASTDKAGWMHVPLTERIRPLQPKCSLRRSPKVYHEGKLAAEVYLDDLLLHPIEDDQPPFRLHAHYGKSCQFDVAKAGRNQFRV